LPAPTEYGGGGADVVTTILALEALGYGCADNGLVFAINAHMWTSVVPLWHVGTEEQRRTWLPKLCSGEVVGCHAMTEPDAGSDPFSITTSARRTADGWVLKGTKTFITNGPVADLVIAFARTSEGIGPYGITAFLVPAGTSGMDTSGEIDKMGLRTSPMSEVVFDGCVVPESAVLGRVGRGAEVFMHSMAWERACIMASQVGLMRRTMEDCVAYARERKQFGQSIGKFESIADKIADMRVAVDAGRALALRVGWLMDHGRDTTLESAIAKLFISEANVRTHLDAVQIHGGYGYTTEFEVERALRDSIAGRIYSGTSEIQRRIIAKRLGL
jgi:alkylation response protein AidB-like acyl-CoA dehydrogenase